MRYHRAAPQIVGVAWPPSRPQIDIALRLQFGDPDHAAAVGGDETRQQVLQFTFCDFMVLPQAASSTPALEN